MVLSHRPGLLAASPAALPVAAGVVALAVYAALLLSRADQLLDSAYDQAFFEQVVWNASHGRGFSSGFLVGNFLGTHFSPLLTVPAALQWIWADSRLLSILNAAGLAAAAPAGYLLAAALLPGRRWLAAALAAPLPAWLVVQQAVIAEFHTEALALPVALAAGWAGITGRALLMWPLALMTLAAKEDQSYTVVVVGLLVASQGRRFLGLGLAAGAALWGALAVFVAMPLLRAGQPSLVADYYGWLLHADAGALAGSLYHPAGWLAYAGLLASIAALPLLSLRWLALSLPPLLADLLSHHPVQPDLGLHYGLLLVLPVFVAGVLGARRLPVAGRVPAAVPAALLALPALLIGLGATPLLRPGAEPALHRLRACTAALPPAAPVAADDSVAAPLAARPRLTVIGLAAAADYVVVDRRGRQPGYVDLEERRSVVARLSERRPVLCDDGRFQLWGPEGAAAIGKS